MLESNEKWHFRILLCEFLVVRYLYRAVIYTFRTLLTLNIPGTLRWRRAKEWGYTHLYAYLDVWTYVRYFLSEIKFSNNALVKTMNWCYEWCVDRHGIGFDMVCYSGDLWELNHGYDLWKKPLLIRINV